MLFSTNPYVAGNPVGDSPAFVGRADILREVLRVLRHPKENAIVLYGQRRIGKTSVLQELEAKLPSNYYPIFFDLQDKAQWPLARVLCELAQKISDKLGQATPNLGDDPETTFRQVWLPELLNNLSQKSSLVFLFDEFDALDDPESEKAGATFFPYLRDLLTINQKHLNFVFVIGRKVDDLTNIALSLFKTTLALRVSLLNQQDTIELVRMSEANNSLIWSDDAIETVWQLTGGHPFLTQRLCSRIWERLYDNDPDRAPTVISKDVDAAIPDTLSASRNALEWLWGGLPPVERMIISALASAGAKPVPENQLEGFLRESGIHFVIQELQTLQNWDLIEFVDGGYCFRVELIRQWIAEYKPLSQVQKKFNSSDKANIYYYAGFSFYDGGNLEKALHELNRAVMANPTHEKANQKLADILKEEKQYEEARERLEHLYKYHPVAARERLISVLLTLAQISESEHGQKGEEEQLEFYKRVLELNAEEPQAIIRWQEIWQRRGNKVLGIKSEDDFEQLLAQVSAQFLAEALKCYQEGKLEKQAKKIQDEQDRRTMLAGWYQQGKVALRNGDKQKAQEFFILVVTARPNYEKAAKYLNKAVAEDFSQTWLIPTINKKFISATAVIVFFLIVGGFFFIPFDTSVTPDNVIGSNEDQLVTTFNTLTQMLENRRGFNAVLRSNFSYVDEETKEPAGFDVDILREFARRWFDNENAITLIPMTADHYVDNVVNKTVMIVTSTTTESVDMKEHIDFSFNYFRYRPRLLVRKDVGITDVCKLKGKKIAAIQGATAIKTVKKALKAKCGFAIEIDDRVQNNSEIIEALKGQEVKAFITNEGTALKFLLDVHADLEPILVMLDYEFKKEFYRFGVPKGDYPFLNLVNLTLQKMEADGTYARIYCKWFVTEPPYALEFPESINDDPKLEKKVKMKSSSFKECYPIEYTVQNGDTLSELAERFYGKSMPKHWDHIFGYDKNKETGVLIDNKPDRQINAGKKLWIPKPPENG